LAPLDDLDHAWTPAPKQPEACTVPPNHGIGSNDGERVLAMDEANQRQAHGVVDVTIACADAVISYSITSS
jgi:hypothetical protein